MKNTLLPQERNQHFLKRPSQMIASVFVAILLSVTLSSATANPHGSQVVLIQAHTQLNK
jgi:hypothetical protein